MACWCAKQCWQPRSRRVEQSIDCEVGLRSGLVLGHACCAYVFDPPPGARELCVEHIEQLVGDQREIRRLVVEMGDDASFGIDVDNANGEGSSGIIRGAMGVR